MNLNQAQPVDLDQAKRDYVHYFTAKGYSPISLMKWCYTIQVFLNYLISEKITEIEQITDLHIKDYIQIRHYYINQKGRQNGLITRNMEIKAIRNWFKFLYESEVLTDNPAKNLHYLKMPSQKLPRDILTKSELKKILITAQDNTINGQIAELCFEIFYATGIRLAELAHLKVSEINFQEKTIFINEGKGKKDRMIPINNTALAKIKYYLQTIRPNLRLANQKEELLLPIKAKILTPQLLAQYLMPYIKKARLKKKITPHSFRHTVATHLLLKGMPIRHVQLMLGHGKLDTTSRYLQLKIKDLEKAYRKYHPTERAFTERTSTEQK